MLCVSFYDEFDVRQILNNDGTVEKSEFARLNSVHESKHQSEES